MKWSPSTRLAFYHIHKTGGTSFLHSLAAAVPDLTDVDAWPHWPLAHYYEQLSARGVDPLAVRVLTIIRNPFDHVVSIYHFWRQFGDQASGPVAAARNCDFATFVRYYATCGNPGCSVYDELLLIDGALPANVHILRLENLQEDAQKLLNREWGLAERICIPHLNSSVHAHSAEYYTEETLQIVRSRYRWAFEQGFYASELPA